MGEGLEVSGFDALLYRLFTELRDKLIWFDVFIQIV